MDFKPYRMPWSCYSRFIELCLNKLRSPWLLAYIDNLIVHTVMMEQHLEELEKVFWMHHEAGIKLRAQKMYLFKEEANYLGYKITPEGIRMRDDYVQKILEGPRLTMVKQLNAFLGFVGYYQTFITKFSYLANKMNEQKRSTKVVWTPLVRAEFREESVRTHWLRVKTLMQKEEFWEIDGQYHLGLLREIT